MAYPTVNEDLILDGTVRSGERVPLAIQHLSYTIFTEQNRAVLTQCAMNNTAVLTERAVETMNDNPYRELIRELQKLLMTVGEVEQQQEYYRIQYVLFRIASVCQEQKRRQVTIS